MSDGFDIPIGRGPQKPDPSYIDDPRLDVLVDCEIFAQMDLPYATKLRRARVLLKQLDAVDLRRKRP